MKPTSQNQGISVLPKTKYVVNQNNTYVFAAGQLPNGQVRIIPNDKFKLQKGQIVFGTKTVILDVLGQGEKEFAVILTGNQSFRLVFLTNLDPAPVNFIDDEPEPEQVKKSVSGINKVYLMLGGTFLPGFVAMFFAGALMGAQTTGKTSKLLLAFAGGSAIGGYMTAKILKKQDAEMLNFLGKVKTCEHPGTSDTRTDK